MHGHAIRRTGRGNLTRNYVPPLSPSLTDRLLRRIPAEGVQSFDPLPRFGRRARVAILVAVLWVLCVGTYQALTAGPYHVRDEQAHIGYAMSLSSGRVPTIETPTRMPPTSPALAERLAETKAPPGELTPYQKVWVANHPPGAYLPALPGVWAGRLLGSGNAVVFALRLSNIAGFAATVVLAALLTREVTRRTAPAVLAAVLTAANPYLQYITAWAMTDGMTIVVTTAAVWAAVRALRRGFDRNSTVVVAVVSAACGITRLTAIATAVLAVGTALAIHAWRKRTIPWRPAVLAAVTVAVTSGWFWIGNLVRYGNLAASDQLYERFNRDANGTVLSTLTTRRFWKQMLSTVLEHTRDWDPLWRGTYMPLTVAILTVAGVGLFALLDRVRTRSDVADPTGAGDAADATGHVEAGSLLILLAAWVAAAILIANHIKSGGNPFGRYVLIWIPITACLVGSTLMLLRRSIVATGAAAIMVAVYVHHAHNRLSHYTTTLEYRFAALPNSALRRPLGPEWSQDLMYFLSGTLAVVVVAALVLAVLRESTPEALVELPERTESEHRIDHHEPVSGNGSAPIEEIQVDLTEAGEPAPVR